jgi:hypothetical protein
MVNARAIWLRARRLFCERWPMPKRKPLTAAEQAQKFREQAKKRASAGLPSITEADDAVDAMIAKNIRDHGA